MNWSPDGWPVIGEHQPDQVFGQPVTAYRKPVAGQAQAVPPFDDGFAAGPHLGWQWQANPGDDWIDRSVTGRLWLNTVSSPVNLWEAGNILAQKMPGTAFSVTVRISLSPKSTGERAGLVIYGADYAWVGLEQTGDGLRLVEVSRVHADTGGAEQVDVASVAISGPVFVRATLAPVTVAQAAPAFADYWPSMLRATQARVIFSFSLDGKTFQPVGPAFVSAPGRWVGAQIGLFAQSPTGTSSYVSTQVGHAEFEDFVASP
jgi:beta-xylosidase